MRGGRRACAECTCGKCLNLSLAHGVACGPWAKAGTCWTCTECACAHFVKTDYGENLRVTILRWCNTNRECTFGVVIALSFAEFGCRHFASLIFPLSYSEVPDSFLDFSPIYPVSVVFN